MKSKTRCVIIDDEQHAITLLTHYISSMPNLELYKTYRNPLLALSEISKDDDVDIIFLDIEMPDINGLELAIQLRGKTQAIIFISAYDKYALQAFDGRANRYLIKPIKLATFTQTVISVIENELDKCSHPGSDIAFFKTGERGKLSRVNKQEILYFESARNYVNMVTSEKGTLVYLTLKEIEKIFRKDLFCRVHRSHVINVTKIQKIVGNTINLGEGVQVQMGNAYKAELLKFLEDRTFLTGRI